MVSLACARISWTFMVSPSIARSVPRHRAAVHDPCHGYDLVACLFGAPHQPCSRCLASGEAQARRQTLYLVQDQAAFFDVLGCFLGWIRCGSWGQPYTAQTRSASSAVASRRSGSITLRLPWSHLG